MDRKIKKSKLCKLHFIKVKSLAAEGYNENMRESLQ